MEFQPSGHALLRATRYPGITHPSSPDVADVAGSVDWLRKVWASLEVVEAIGHANPGFARRVRALCTAVDPSERQVRRAVFSAHRYLLRMSGRPTPSGLFAGVAPVRFGARARVAWGAADRVVARADPAWLADVIGQIERCPEALSLLCVTTNSTLTVRGDRVMVPHQLGPSRDRTATVDVSLRYSAPVSVALGAARSSIGFGDLCEKVSTSFPDVPGVVVTAMLTELVARRALVTSLHAPATEPDALGYMLSQLAASEATDVEPIRATAAVLRDVHGLLNAHGRRPPSEARAVRDEAAARMLPLAPAVRHPVALDARLDVDAVLPTAVAHEAASAALTLARVSAHPSGRRAWREYHRRFYERFGAGVLVPVRDVVADSGISWPDGYPGAVQERRGELTRRDDVLLALAQGAALDGVDEVTVDEPLVARLALDEGAVRLPPHLELSVRVDALDVAALGRGDFRLTVLSVSRGAGVSLGRFLDLLGEDCGAGLRATLATLPAGDHDTLPAQVSFPPLAPATAHVARSAQALPVVVSLAEHRHPGPERVLTVDELAVGCDSHRLYLAAPRLGKRVEPCGMHALNLRTHTPPLARFLTELPRALCAQVTAFDWGAASTLPFLPRLRYGRTVLSPATWRLGARELPGRTVSRDAWGKALADWRSRRRVPRRVLVREDDRRLPLDLDVPLHRALLRDHLASKPLAVLEEAPAEGDAGWCSGRAHEVVVPLVATAPPAWPQPRRPAPDQLLRRDPRQAPGTSSLLFAKLYGDVRRQDTVLSNLPSLLATWGEDEPTWWFLRFREGREHYLRLRVRLPGPAAFGVAAGRVTAWAEGLRQEGLVRELAYATSFPEVGRWGSGPALAAAEDTFAADSRAVLTQLSVQGRPQPRALAAANFVAIASGFTGDVSAGIAWLVDHVPRNAPAAVPRPSYAEAVRLADPRDGFTELRRVPGGAGIVASWGQRAEALARYRSHVSGPHATGVDPDDALGSLIHAHFLRANGVDLQEKAVCLYLARAAALAVVARTGHRP